MGYLEEVVGGGSVGGSVGGVLLAQKFMVWV
jgi:hypothetical protein